MNSWEKWLFDVTGGSSARAIAVATGHSRTSIGKWSESGLPPAEFVFEVARAYPGADLIPGLLAAGLLSMGDVQRAIQLGITRMPTTLLSEELHRRATAFEGSRIAGEPYVPEWIPEFPSQA